jgi:diguanylate cyclase (GGDEF)-like protein
VRRLEKWVAAEKRGMRIGHGQDELTRRGVRHAGGPGNYPSTLAVPLIVEERVVGVLMVQSVLRDAYDEHHLAVLTTIAQQAAVAIENARNYRMATVDSLTGVSLRDYFFQRVKEEHHRASRYSSRFALLMIDLDGFKAINDAFGHQVGDRYLSLLGMEIRTHLRSADIACRYGGDEFCVLLPETGFEGARTIAERLRHAVANLSIELDGESAATTASIGMAIFPEHGADSLASLLKHADQALYRAKRQGKNQVLPFAPRQDRPVVKSGRPEPEERTVRPAGRNVR